MIRPIAVVIALVGFSSTAVAQDPVKVDPEHHKVELENAQVRVLRITLEPGAKTLPADGDGETPVWLEGCLPMPPSHPVSVRSPAPLRRCASLAR